MTAPLLIPDKRLCEATGKVRYTNKHAARKAMKYAGTTIRVYRCDDCGGVHVTKERQKR